jgi:hypothetical protein
MVDSCDAIGRQSRFASILRIQISLRLGSLVPFWNQLRGMQKAALYARVSSNAQKQERTIESQVAELKLQCGRRDVPDFTLDLGGLIGGVVGAVAAAFGVVYSLRRTDAYNRLERAEKITRLRAAIVVEARLIGTELYNFNMHNLLKPTNYAPREFYRTQNRIAVAEPTLMRTALSELSSLPRQEAERILFLLNANLHLQRALARARSAPSDAEFETAVTAVHEAFMFLCPQIGLLLELMSPDEIIQLTPPRKMTVVMREISTWPKWWTIAYPQRMSEDQNQVGSTPANHQ